MLAACRAINDPAGFGLGARSIAISTAGWVPGIDRLADEPLQVKLALSLHAPNDALRSELMPVTRRFPLERLMQACAGYRERTRRRIFVEYLLLDGVNDSDALPTSSAGLLPAAGYHVNLIAYNPTGSGSRLAAGPGRGVRPPAAPSAGWPPATAGRTGRTSMRRAASWPSAACASCGGARGAAHQPADRSRLARWGAWARCKPG